MERFSASATASLPRVEREDLGNEVEIRLT